MIVSWVKSNKNDNEYNKSMYADSLNRKGFSTRFSVQKPFYRTKLYMLNKLMSDARKGDEKILEIYPEMLNKTLKEESTPIYNFGRFNPEQLGQIK